MKENDRSPRRVPTPLGVDVATALSKNPTPDQLQSRALLVDRVIDAHPNGRWLRRMTQSGQARAALLILLLALGAVGGCFDLDYGGSHFQCTADTDCPTGHACVRGCCGGGCPDAGTIAVPDAPAPVTPRLCPVGLMWSAPAAACVPGLAGMVELPGGTFLMGAGPDDPKAHADEAPVHVMSLNTIFFDRAPVTVAAYRLCKAPGCTTPGMGGACNWTATPGARENHPVNCISQRQAQAYCDAQKKRLPTEAEWEHAARGPRSSRYAWGSAAPLSPGSGTTPQLCWQQQSTCPVGAYGDTLLGAPADPGTALVDLTGNVWQWTSTIYCDYATGKDCNGFFVLRGGAWNRTDPGDVRAARRNATPAEAQPSDVGVRCARDP